ncbi:MAG: ABC-F family ATP-binding cassette domain-containing protein [Bacteroidales bacterium]|nr:ABC-F family ATP-binding cassette domain-containing protein [Bacteroidales bacterium]
MPSYLQIENISKSYGPKVLFEHIGFNVNEGDKIALIAPNGTGKTSLMRILAGKDKSDSGGKILFLKDIRIAFLEQDYGFDPEATVFDQVMNDSRQWTRDLDEDGVREYATRVRKFLGGFGLQDPSRKMGSLSGGEVKRVALAGILASEADFLIMDEPTNHLDIDAIEFLEGYLSRSRCTLFMVTHDRYFLDRVCNIVMELDHGAVYTYRGDYENYLEKRQERIDNYDARTEKVRNVLRRELEWMRSTPCARSGKAKYRKEAFYALKDRAEAVYRTARVDMGEIGGASRLGTKIINCKDVSLSYGDRCLLSHFTYNFQRYEKVGIVGRNGAGKTSFVNLLTGDLLGGTVSGTVDRGESLKIGYYRQEGMAFDEDQTVLETVNDTSLLSQFLFNHDMLNNKVSTLSGGERRRLYLLTILRERPNLLILDEPTNDLDIVTLDILEEYLTDFKGTLVIISHDRHFLDRLTDHLLVFPGDGTVKDFIGKFSEWRAYVKALEAGKRNLAKEEGKARKASPAPAPIPAPGKDRKRLTFKEKRELEQMEADIEAYTREKQQLESDLNSGALPYDALQSTSSRLAELTSLLETAENRWLELKMVEENN